MGESVKLRRALALCGGAPREGPIVVVVANSLVCLVADAAGAFRSDVTMENWNRDQEAIGLGAFHQQA